VTFGAFYWRSGRAISVLVCVMYGGEGELLLRLVAELGKPAETRDRAAGAGPRTAD
jgi:hypothetical protein